MLDELGIALPTADVPLHLLTDEPIPAAQSHPERFEAGGVERVKALRDRVWFKLKSGRWRGAVVRLTDRELVSEAETHDGDTLDASDRWWLGAAGLREDGSRRDFYATVAAQAQCERSPQNPDGVNTDDLLPQGWDRKRLRLERAYQQRKVFEEVLITAAARSLLTGKAVMADFSVYSMGVLIRADRGEQYVAFIAKNVLDVRVLAVMLDSILERAPDEDA